MTRADHNYCKCHAPGPTALHPLRRMRCKVHLLIGFKKLSGLLTERQYSRILSKRYLLHSRESPVADTRGSLSTSDDDHTPHSKHRISSAVAVFLRKTTKRYLLHSRESPVADTRGSLSTSDDDHTPHSKHRISSAVAVFLRKTTPGWTCSKQK